MRPMLGCVVRSVRVVEFKRDGKREAWPAILSLNLKIFKNIQVDMCMHYKEVNAKYTWLIWAYVTYRGALQTTAPEGAKTKQQNKTQRELSPATGQWGGKFLNPIG